MNAFKQFKKIVARAEALCDVIHDPNGVAYPFEDMQDKMTFILNALTQGDEA